jgi:hypothetical protein
MERDNFPRFSIDMPDGANMWHVIDQRPSDGNPLTFYLVVGTEADVVQWKPAGSLHAVKEVWNIHGTAHRRSVSECEARITELNAQIRQLTEAADAERERLVDLSRKRRRTESGDASDMHAPAE